MHWWSSYGNFEPDGSGLYPLPGQVLAQYRARACLSRDDVAAHLGIGAKALYYAEYEGRGLDSISRLRQVRALLNIPHALLGLCAAPALPGWWISDYHPWPASPDGWPNVGVVVKHYRRFSKRWTQVQLAVALGIQELGVRHMENQRVGLDSISRRRALRFLLGIPPLLVGQIGRASCRERV